MRNPYVLLLLKGLILPFIVTVTSGVALIVIGWHLDAPPAPRKAAFVESLKMKALAEAMARPRAF